MVRVKLINNSLFHTPLSRRASKVSHIMQMTKGGSPEETGGIVPKRKEIVLQLPKDLQGNFSLPSQVTQPDIVHFMCWQKSGGEKIESTLPAIGGGAFQSDTVMAYNAPYGKIIQMALDEQKQTLKPGERAYMVLPLSPDTTYGGTEAEKQATNHVVVVAMQDGAWATAMVPISMMNDTSKSQTLGSILQKALPQGR